MKSKKKSVIKTVGYIYIKDRRILLVLAAGKKAYFMPGGKINDGEDDVTALVRELKEELSVDLIPESLKFYEVFEAQAHGKPEGILVHTTCYRGKHIGDFLPNSEIVDFRYFTAKEYSDMEDTAPLGHIINRHLRENGLID